MPNLVGRKIPDMTAQALMPDGRFEDIRLADYAGKWLILFFYPLDHTFV